MAQLHDSVKRRRVGSSLRPKPPTERLNPQVLRAFLHEMITERFDRDVTAAAEAIDQTRPLPGRKGHYKSDFKPETLYDLVHDRARIKYYQLEAIAHFYNMPVSLLLLFTRIRSELEDSNGGIEKSKDIIRSVRIFLGMIESAILRHELDAKEGRRIPDSKNILNFALFENLAELFPRDNQEDQETFSFLRTFDG